MTFYIRNQVFVLAFPSPSNSIYLRLCPSQQWDRAIHARMVMPVRKVGGTYVDDVDWPQQWQWRWRGHNGKSREVNHLRNNGSNRAYPGRNTVPKSTISTCLALLHPALCLTWAPNHSPSNPYKQDTGAPGGGENPGSQILRGELKPLHRSSGCQREKIRDEIARPPGEGSPRKSGIFMYGTELRDCWAEMRWRLTVVHTAPRTSYHEHINLVLVLMPVYASLS